MNIILDGVTAHAGKHRAFRGVPFHKLAPLMRKMKVQVQPGRANHVECDVRCDGSIYHLVLFPTKTINNTMHAHVVTAWAK